MELGQGSVHSSGTALCSCEFGTFLVWVVAIALSKD